MNPTQGGGEGPSEKIGTRLSVANEGPEMRYAGVRRPDAPFVWRSPRADWSASAMRETNDAERGRTHQTWMMKVNSGKTLLAMTGVRTAIGARRQIPAQVFHLTIFGS
ncbi:MAG TPA: hypothetical protein VGR53_08875 [Nitrososphaerales archaeon]|nr:hypothetical protein [Nitrososphaerales archaeon]